jgi:WD40 repeat protein
VRVSPLITVKQLSEELKYTAQPDQVLQLVFQDDVLQNQKSLVEAGLHHQAAVKVILVQDFFLAVGLKGGDVKLFSGQTGELRKTLRPSQGRFAPDSMHFRSFQSIVMGSNDATGSFIYKVDLSTGGRKLLMRFGFDLTCACLSHDGSLVVAGDNNGSVGIWSIDKMQVALEQNSNACFLDPNLRQWRACHDDQALHCVMLSPNGELVATNCANEDSVVLWHADTGKRARTIRKKNDPSGVHTFINTFSPCGDIIAVMTLDISQKNHTPIELWTVAGGKCLKVLRGTRNDEDADGGGMVFSPDGDALAVNASPGIVDIFDLRQSVHKVLSVPCTDEQYSMSMAFSSDGSLLATASIGASEVQVWCSATWDIKCQFRVVASNRRGKHFNRQISCLAFAA